MSAVTRLVTYAGLDDRADDATISVAVRHEAELADGSRVLLLDDRGWSESGPPGIWATSVAQVEATARTVVGPDEPYGDLTHEDMAAGHWAFLQQTIQRAGGVADAAELRRLPHDVVLSAGLLARLGGVPDGDGHAQGGSG